MGSGKDDGGGSSDYALAPPTVQEESGPSTEEMMAMMTMMASMSQSNVMETPEALPAPTLLTGDDYNWEEKQDQIYSMEKSSQSLDAARKKGRLDTIHTSPLLDDEPANTTKSLLGAGV